MYVVCSNRVKYLVVLLNVEAVHVWHCIGNLYVMYMVRAMMGNDARNEPLVSSSGYKNPFSKYKREKVNAVSKENDKIADLFQRQL